MHDLWLLPFTIYQTVRKSCHFQNRSTFWTTLFVFSPTCAILPRNILHFRAHRWVNINLCTFWRLHLCRGTARGSSAVCHAWSVTPTIHHLPNSPKILSFSKSIDCYLVHKFFSPYCPFTSILYKNKMWKLHSLRFWGVFCIKFCLFYIVLLKSYICFYFSP